MSSDYRDGHSVEFRERFNWTPDGSNMERTRKLWEAAGLGHRPWLDRAELMEAQGVSAEVICRCRRHEGEMRYYPQILHLISCGTGERIPV